MNFLIALLVNSVWESFAVLAAAAGILALAKSSSATTRYAVWSSALVLTVLLPVATTLAPMFTHQSVSVQPATHVRHQNSESAPLPRAASLPRSARPAAQPAMLRRPEVKVLPMVGLVLLGLWGVAAAVLLARFVMAIGILESLKRNAKPLPVEYRERLLRWQSTRSAERTVRLCVSEEIRVPVAIGMFDAMILLPSSLIEDLSPDDIDRIVLHEYAHLERRDDWINAFERLTLAVFFFNPAIRYIARQMDIEREVSCDDSVVQDTHEAVPLATCLVKMVERVEWPYKPLAAPGVFDTRRDLSLRVERLLLFTRDRRTRIAALPALSAVGAMLLLVVAGTFVSPVLVFAQTENAKAVVAGVEHAKRPDLRVKPKIDAHRMILQPRPMPAVMPKGLYPKIATGPSWPKTPSVKPVTVPAHAHILPKTILPPGTSMKMQMKVQTKTKTVASSSANVNANTATPDATPQTLARADFIDEMNSVGYSNLTVDELVALKNMGVTASFVREIQSAGFPHPTVRELLSLRAGGVTPDFMTRMRAHFGSTLTLRQMSELGTMGVTDSYISELASAGFPNLSEREVVEARAMGVDRAFIDTVKAHGFKNLSFHQLINLKASGVLK